MDGRQLRALFQEFNGQYFNGRLPVYTLRAVEYSTWLGESGRCFRKRRRIEVNRGLSDEEAISTLLHEMAHASTGDNHAMPWKREMIRLRQAGAPLVSCDLNVNLTDWSGGRVTKRQFQAETQDLLMGCESNGFNLTLPAAIKNFMRNVGGPGTVAEFLRKYPWVAAVLKDEKRAHAEYQERLAALRLKMRRERTE